MPNMQVNVNGTWQPLFGMPYEGGNADTVDGKHASDFAPSGYGLGTLANNSIASQSLDTISGSGWYLGIPVISGFAFGNTLIEHHDYSSYCVQVAHLFNDTSGLGKNITLKRTKEAGVWGEWEWENPPMKVGVEYRTTERWDGRPVYCKVVDCGLLPNNSTKHIPAAKELNSFVIRFSGFAVNSNVSIPFENSLSGIISIYSTEAATSVSIITNEDMTEYYGYLTLYYVKST